MRSKRDILVDLLNKTNDELERIHFYEGRTQERQDIAIHQAEREEVKRMQSWIIDELARI